MPSESIEITLARIEERQTAMLATVNQIVSRFDTFVTQAEFRPVRMIAYGAVALLTTLVITAVVAAAF